MTHAIPLTSLLIANRGEIVTRVARTARGMGIKTIAVASNADLNAPHTASCDLTMPIGGEHPADSYLRADKLIAAAGASGAQAVHPGYGFLAENAAFAQAVIDAGLVWIGPPPSAMHTMGDKARARQRMAAAGVPVLPGYDGDDQSRGTLQREAHAIGWPLMVKAVAGGGGRGMRLVLQADALDAAISSAQAETQGAFGDARLMLERALIAPRHVEVQVFADTHGHVLHLGERDCSVQRRHQKIIEEAPSPAVSPALRRRMGDVAVAVAREVGYVGAGTVEFLLGADGTFWFMEMNTRLQVEHPLTEALVGVDLVEWQLRIAAGEALPLSQSDALERFERGGHAIEVRLCAEDPALGFLPQAGTIELWKPPAQVRCDHALSTPCAVSPFFDSMLGKLIAHAPTRAAALLQLARALDTTVCLGLPTNRAFLVQVLRHPAFVEVSGSAGFAGDGVNTAFIATHFPDAAPRAQPVPSWLQALAAAATCTLETQALPLMWQRWTTSNVIATDALLEAADGPIRWQLRGSPADLTAHCGADEHRVQALRWGATSEGSPDAAGPESKLVSAIVDGRPVTAVALRIDARWLWLCEGIELSVADQRLAGAGRSALATEGSLCAPMHGRVTQVLAVPGSTVQAGDLLVVMEAMKMEHLLHAPRSGTVAAVLAHDGEQVAASQVLVELAP